MTYAKRLVLTTTYTWLTSTPHTVTNAHRPWACRGMPFDDVCQIPSSDARAPRLGAGIFYSFGEDARCWGGSRARSGVCGFPTLESAPAGNDLENYPYDLAKILHVAPNGHCKNKSLLAFCWEKSKCWSKMRFSDEIFDFFYFDSQNLATGSR